MPALQGIHSVWFPLATVPGPHAAQLLAPGSGATSPAAQRKHKEAFAANVPASQGVHTSTVLAPGMEEVVPAGQGTHTSELVTLSAGLYVPAGQALQSCKDEACVSSL